MDPYQRPVPGAWFETLLPTGGRGPDGDLEERLSPNTISEQPELQNQAPLKHPGPPLPKSAFEEIPNEAKSGKTIHFTTNSSELDEDEDPTLHLGDSTIQSLEELIANDTDCSLLAPTLPSAEKEETSPPTTDPSPSSQGALTTTTTTSTSFNPSRLTDLQSYTQLLTRLTNLAPSIRASKKQLALLERSISSLTGPNQTRTLTHHNQNADSECNEAGPIHDFIYPCHNCDCPGLSLPNLPKTWTTLTLPIPRLYLFPPSSHFPHPTRLGAITTLLFTLFYLESWAQATYCHPLYATHMSGYGVDINAPRPPFVLVKVLYRGMGLGSLW